ncbi:MAG: tRNA uridine-5-carboxymethylaminomethyl(34) synthesis GTPase MnmE [Deltaproteobacteria bacterium]|nr:MAG: tRNA uridine-5-carboxymethylaminomethyl(34) synthesis GTPase MnmE [Deltaproteobacteria bacterium]
MDQEADTIAAIATPVGQAGIGIIRISGPEALKIAKRIFRPRNPLTHFKSHRLYLGHIYDPNTGLNLDEVLLSYMKAPHTYTREDVVEINSHSGFLLLSKILELVIDSGARLARPGEFTLRAYLNGRIDLTQAEAVIDLIRSRSERGLHLASQQIKGVFKEKIYALREKILEILSHVEAAIDFPEEEDTFLDKGRCLTTISGKIIPEVDALIKAHSEKKIWIDGINTVIAGRVNVGKSSLLNCLLDEQRAIVTSIPGTTRDIIESSLTIEGIPLRLMDTAGLRKVSDEVEKIGIRLTEQKLNEADLILAVIDQSEPLTQDDLSLLDQVKDKATLVVLNKIDLPAGMDWDKALGHFSSLPVAKVSALTGEGMESLKKAIVRLVIGQDKDLVSSSIAPNLRQTRALKQAKHYLMNAAACIESNAPLELVALELKSGLDSLGEIVGETTPEEVLENIFSNFCIGK